jgi:DNA helicase HerA-like ATPase
VSAFRLPGAADRTVVIGATGSGKTTFAAWLLSRQRLDLRPWVILDYKREALWDQVGKATIRPLRTHQLPGKTGLYRIQIDPGHGEDEALEDWLWRIRRRGNVGLFCDEAANLPVRGAFKAILRQGRSLRIPVISCTQRPVEVDREIFSESGFKSVFRLEDERDYLIIRGMTRRSAIDRPLPRYWSYWYDAERNRLVTLRPAPEPDSVAAELRAAAPSYALFGV